MHPLSCGVRFGSIAIDVARRVSLYVRNASFATAGRENAAVVLGHLRTHALQKTSAWPLPPARDADVALQ